MAALDAKRGERAYFAARCVHRAVRRAMLAVMGQRGRPRGARAWTDRVTQQRGSVTGEDRRTTTNVAIERVAKHFALIPSKLAAIMACSSEDASEHKEEASIRIVDMYLFHGKIAVGLEIRSSYRFPLTVGCSIRSDSGRIIDIPSRTLSSEGVAIWEIEAPSECRRSDAGMSPYEWGGDILFAVWRDTSYSRRLSDTGWVKWAAPWLVGHSGAGLVHQEDEIRRKYGPRKNAWKDDSA